MLNSRSIDSRPLPFASFGLTVSLKKTEVMLQSDNPISCTPPLIKAGNIDLNDVDKFTYLGSILSSDAVIDNDVSSRLSEASASFGRLSKRLWDDHGIRLDTKVAVYKAAVLTILLYGSESWVSYRRHIVKLDQFHMRCLLRISHVKWQDKVPNTEVLQICSTSGIEACLIAAQLRWPSHVIRMDDSRLPKLTFYSQLEQGARSRGGQRKRYKDVLKMNLKVCSIRPEELEPLAADRSVWRARCQEGVANFECDPVSALQDK
jgi:hypothetical protein